MHSYYYCLLINELIIVCFCKGFVTDTDKEQSLTAKLLNDELEYSLKVGAEVSGDANRKKYEPLLEYKEPQGGKQWSLVGRKGGTKGGKTQQSLGITGLYFKQFNFYR